MPKRAFKSSIDGRHIFLIRKKMILTQRELAKILGVSYDTLNSWEQGRRYIGIENERKIKEYCKVNGIKL